MMIHNFAGWTCQPTQELAQEQLAQDPQISGDEMDKFFPCVDITESEDEGSLTLIPETDTAKEKKGIVQQDDIIYLHSLKRANSV